MKWLCVLVTVVAGSIGDLLSAKGMSRLGERRSFRPAGIAGNLRYIVTHPAVIAGIAANAVSFVSFIGLLSVSELSFAVPVTALGYILRTVLAKVFLGELVNWKRWTGVVLVAIGVLLISV
jgi:drug/metabolite transporter (DMT)-like permease